MTFKQAESCTRSIDVQTTARHDGALPERRFPDFLGIGAQKAGTTWLFNNLKRHPRIWMPPVKELHYFNDVYVPSERKWTKSARAKHGSLALRRYLARVAPENWDYAYIGCVADIVAREPSDDWYGRIFALAGRTARCGEITPRYAVLPPEGIAHVRALMPDAKIIFLVRDPIERCWSHIRMNIDSRASEAQDSGKLAAMARSPGMSAHANYPKIIECWTSCYPSDRFLTIPFDDISENPAHVLRQTCAFLDLDFEAGRFKQMNEPVHVGRKQDIPPEIYRELKENLRPIYDEILQMFPKVGRTWFARHY
jgi:hypothetical protein